MKAGSCLNCVSGTFFKLIWGASLYFTHRIYLFIYLSFLRFGIKKTFNETRHRSMAEEIKYSGIEGKNIFSKVFKTLTASVCQV